MTWEDDGNSSGKKFKFIHIIVVSIIFLLLGSYLAKVPIAAAPAAEAPADAEPAAEEKTAESSN